MTKEYWNVGIIKIAKFGTIDYNPILMYGIEQEIMGKLKIENKILAQEGNYLWKK